MNEGVAIGGGGAGGVPIHGATVVPIGQPCFWVEELAAAYRVELTGITEGTSSQECLDFNGSWLLDIQFACRRAADLPGLIFGKVVFLRMEVFAGSVQLVLANQDLSTVIANWFAPIVAFDPLGATVLTLNYVGITCSTLPATVTIIAEPEVKPFQFTKGGAGTGDGRTEVASEIGGGGSVGNALPPVIAYGGSAGGGGAIVASAETTHGGSVGDGGYGFDEEPEIVNTGFVLCGLGENNASAGDLSWTAASNIASGTASSASRTILGHVDSLNETQLLIARSFGLSVPGGATIVGAVVRYQGYYATTLPNTSLCRMWHSGAFLGSDNKATQSAAIPASPTPGLFEFGGSADLWGAALTPAIVNDASFGVAFAADVIGLGSVSSTIYIQHVWLDVYYYE